MTIQSKQYLIDHFKQGDVPTGQDFRDFIDSFIGSINGNMPDAAGNVTVPIAYQVVDMFTPDTPPSQFALGTSVLVFNYNPADNPQWRVLLGENVQAGEIFIVTQSYPEEGITIQEIDTSIDGLFLPSLTRTNIRGTDTWGPINKITPVLKINGESPDMLGNITVDSGAKGDTGEQGPQGERGLQGEKGEKGEKGETGPQGEVGPQGNAGEQGTPGMQGDQGDVGPRGIQGERGEKGERGEGFVVAETYASLAAAEADLVNGTVKDMEFIAIVNGADATENGDVYILEGGVYVFQFKAVGVQGEKGESGSQGLQGERGLQGPRGIQGEQGIQGQQGIRGERGPIGLTPDLVDATTTSKGVVQIGTGLEVNNGVLSVAGGGQKRFLSASRITADQTITTANQRVIFNNVLESNGIALDTSTGIITLPSGGPYYLNFEMGLDIATATSFMHLGVHNEDTLAFINSQRIAINSPRSNTNFNENSIPSMTIIIPASNAQRRIALRTALVKTPEGSIVYYAKPNKCRVTIFEL